MKSVPYLDKIRIENFKAIQRSDVIRLTPFTAVVGNNGAGKSSLIEALAFLQDISVLDMPSALEPLLGFDQVWNKFWGPKTTKRKMRPMSFELSGSYMDAYNDPAKFKSYLELGYQPEGGKIGFMNESNQTMSLNGVWEPPISLHPTRSFAGRPVWSQIPLLRKYLPSWQFLVLNPGSMGAEQLSGPARVQGLERDGRNIAQYLFDFQSKFPAQFEEFVGAIQYVVPYLQDLRAEQSLDIVKRTFLQIVEKQEKIPGWLLSSGTLRACAVMACLLHPEPPTLLVIEEIENGLDPRTLGLITSTIRSAVESGRTQVIATTHSPAFLDLVPPEYILTVTRAETGEPKFKRVNPKELGKWLEDFSPGRLYSMGMLT